jgi:hypothetical protein
LDFSAKIFRGTVCLSYQFESYRLNKERKAFKTDEISLHISSTKTQSQAQNKQKNSPISSSESETSTTLAGST